MTPQRQLDSFLAKFDPEIEKLARAALAKMRKRLPNAIEFVYDNYNSLVFGFGPSERPSDARFSRARVRMDPKQKRKLVIRSISAKQRPRRPS